jgi:biopolymer transport protein ExbB
MARLSRGGPAALGAHLQGKDSALASLITAAFTKKTDGKEAMLQAMGERSYEVLYELRRNVRPLGIVANVAPLLGLLGTVFGMIRAFDRVSAGGLGRGEELAGGIAEALITTGAGLMVAIPSFLVYHYYRGRSEDLVRLAEAQTTTFVERSSGVPPAPAQPGPGKA